MTPYLLLSLAFFSADPAFKPDQSKLPVAPPQGAKVLLDGSGKHSFLSMAGEEINWPMKDGELTSTAKKNQNHIVSKLHFKDADIHVEFNLPEKGPANSGVYIHGNYEAQILNSFGKEKVTQDDAGALYGFAAPSENACRKPGEWQVFDIRYRAPRRDDAGKITEKGVVSIWFNGKLVQDKTEFGEPKSVFHPFRFGNTPYLDKIRDQQKKKMTGPLFLQDHGNPVKFRNVWVLPADDKAFIYEPKAEKK
ncbi:MAG: 3-keto-disaccharide hydrolase [Fimbriiglobus sp.]